MFAVVGAIAVDEAGVCDGLSKSVGQLVLDGGFHFVDVAVVVGFVLEIEVVFRTLYSHLVIFIEPVDNSATVSSYPLLA